MAPVQCRRQRALARQRRAATAGEQPESVVQAFEHALAAQRRRAGGGHFDRQRDAVEPLADPIDRSRIARSDAEAGVGGAGPFGKQRGGVRAGERWKAEDPLGLDTERLLRRGQELDAARVLEDRLRERGDRLDHVLAVVEHEQAAAKAEAVDERLERVAPGLKLDRHGAGDGGRDLAPIGHGREFDQPDSVLELVQRLLGDLDGQPRLADSAGSGQRHQLRFGEQPFEDLQFLFAPNQARQALGQVVGLDVVRGRGRRFRRRSRRLRRGRRPCQRGDALGDPAPASVIGVAGPARQVGAVDGVERHRKPDLVDAHLNELAFLSRPVGLGQHPLRPRGVRRPDHHRRLRGRHLFLNYRAVGAVRRQGVVNPDAIAERPQGLDDPHRFALGRTRIRNEDIGHPHDPPPRP